MTHQSLVSNRLRWFTTAQRTARCLFFASLMMIFEGMRLVPLNAAEREAVARSSTAAASDVGGLGLPVDRDVEQWLLAARGHLERGESALAAVLLARVLSAEEDSFVWQNSRMVIARDEAWQLSRRLSDEARSQLESDLDRVGSDAWTIAQESPLRDELATLAARHRFSRPGLDALRWLAAQQRDLGQHELAAAALGRVSEHVRATTTQRTVARLVRIECLSAAGRIEAAVRACDMAIREEAAVTPERPVTITISGRNIVPREWLAARRPVLIEAARQATLAQTALLFTNPLSSHPASLMAGPDLVPSPHVQWSRLTPLPTGLSNRNVDERRDARYPGIVSSLALRPLVIGSVVIARTMDQLVGLDLDSGATLWTKPHAEYAALVEGTINLDNQGTQNQVVELWYQRVEADSIFGSLTSDGRMVVAVMEPDRKQSGPSRPAAFNGQPNSSPSDDSDWNRLVAFELTTGELCWQIGGRRTGAADVYGGWRFLGPPLAVDDLWFSIARRKEELNLLAIDSATGNLRWSIELGVLPVHLTESAFQRRVARPISLVDGRLICPTASGALIAVDPFTRGIAWAARYPVKEIEQTQRPVNGVGSGAAVDAWWNEWREVTCCTEEVTGMSRFESSLGDPRALKPSDFDETRWSHLAVLASPESEALHGIDVETGRILWSVSRSGAIHLAGLCAGQAIVVEPLAVRAHDLRTGAVRWRCETGEISGCGTVLGTTFYQPRRSGGVVVINGQNGSKREGFVDEAAPLGMLIPYPGGWLTQTTSALCRIPWLAVSRSAALAKWSADPQVESAALDLARLDLHANQPSEARSRLLNLETPTAKSLHREALLAMLRPAGKSRDAVNSSDSRETPSAEAATAKFAVLDRSVLRAELLGLCESADDRLVALHALGEAAAQQGDLAGAMQFYLDGLDLLDATARRSIGDWSADIAATRFVRRDRAFVGAIERLLNQAEWLREQGRAAGDLAHDVASVEPASTTATRVTDAGRPLEQLLAARLLAARQNTDPFAVQRLVDRLLPLAWGQQTLLAESTAVRYARTLKKTEPALLTVSLSRDERLAATASLQLAELFKKSGWPVEAAAIERRVSIERSNISLSPLPAGVANLPRDPTEAERRTRLLAAPVDPWPNVLPQVEVVGRSPNEEVHFLHVAVDAAPGSLLDRLDVSIDRQGRIVRFAGEEHSGKWTVTLVGPPPLQRSSFAARDQFEAWGVGRLLVLRVGTELFGIAPLDDRGEPHASVAWEFDTAPGLSVQVTEEPIPARVGVRHESIRISDSFGRVLGRVGPVRPDYLCYQSHGNLICTDTQTGKRLWERRALPHKCLTFGDESRVFLWRIEERLMTVLSAVDGRTLREQPWDVSAEDVLMQFEGRVWLTVNDKAGVQIELLDAAIDTSLGESTVLSNRVWSKRFAPQAVPFILDRDTLGVIEPQGLLHLIATQSGLPLGASLTVEVPANLARIVCHHDAWRWYVAFSGPVVQQTRLQSEQLWGGKRIPFLAGPWLAIDRATQSIAWQRTLTNEPLPLAVSRLAPVFVQLWRQPLMGDNEAKGSEGRLQVIDKRTGRQVASQTEKLLQPYYVLSPSANREQLDIRTERDTIRLRYEMETRPEPPGR